LDLSCRVEFPCPKDPLQQKDLSMGPGISSYDLTPMLLAKLNTWILAAEIAERLGIYLDQL
jgi:hypothetical protein